MRKAEIQRDTKETQIFVAVDLDGSGTASVGGPFTLTTQEGKPLSDTDLKGSPFLVFFGFTHCP